MSRKYVNYSVEIKKGQRFDGSKYSDKYCIVPDRIDTAFVTFEYENGEKETLKYGYTDKKAIYDMIENQQNINLNYTYVKDFDYCDVKDKSKKINGFNAWNAFFDGCISFANANFNDGAISFRSACFGDGNVLFDGVIWGEGNVFFKDVYFGSGGVSFKGSCFQNGNVSFANSNFGDSVVSFDKAIFGNGNIFFDKTTFGNQNVSFKDAIFGQGDKQFTGAIFGDGNVSFLGVRFGDGNIYFSYTSFGKGGVSFRRSSFTNGEVDFSNVYFGEGQIDFSYATFEEGNIDFSYATFENNEIDFSNVCFGAGNVNFRNTVFYCGDLKLEQVTASCILFENIKFDSYVNMKFKSCKSLQVIDSTIKDDFDMRSTLNSKVEIDKLLLRNVKNSGQIYLDWDYNKVKKAIYSQEFIKNKVSIPTSYDEKADQFRLLKQNFNNLGQYDDEDKAYVELKRCERISAFKGETLEKGDTRGEHIKYYLQLFCNKATNPFKWLILDKIGNFGTNPFSIFITMLVAVVGFAAAYLASPGLVDVPILANGAPKFTPFWSALYLSIETFLTIGYGNICPANEIGLVLTGLEGFTGVFLMSYFTVAFVRKVLR